MLRRFSPPPWTVESSDACFIVRDRNKQGSTTAISRRNAGQRAAQPRGDRRTAANIGKVARVVTRTGGCDAHWTGKRPIPVPFEFPVRETLLLRYVGLFLCKSAAVGPHAS